MRWVRAALGLTPHRSRWAGARQQDSRQDSSTQAQCRTVKCISNSLVAALGGWEQWTCREISGDMLGEMVERAWERDAARGGGRGQGRLNGRESTHGGGEAAAYRAGARHPLHQPRIHRCPRHAEVRHHHRRAASRLPRRRQVVRRLLHRGIRPRRRDRHVPAARPHHLRRGRLARRRSAAGRRQPRWSADLRRAAAHRRAA